MRHLSVLSLLFAVGCGVSDSTLLVDLSPEQITQLCAEQEDASYHCEQGGVSFDYDVDAKKCGTQTHVDDTCTATVGDYRACDAALRSALDEDPCAGLAAFPSECDWIPDCGVGSVPTGPTGQST